MELGPIAQRLEQQTHNLLVLGSNPSGPTKLPSVRLSSRVNLLEILPPLFPESLHRFHNYASAYELLGPECSPVPVFGQP
jgi:hypothetical protein